MNGKLLVTAVVLGALSFACPARISYGESDIMTFRGLRFGEDVRKQIPECTKKCQFPDYDGYCHYLDLPKKTCWKAYQKAGKTPARIIFFDSLSEKLGIQEAGINQIDDKLSAVTFYFTTAAFTVLESLFREKYGNPTRATEAPWQSKGGVSTTSQTRIWELKGLHVEIKAPTDSIDEGRGSLQTPQQQVEEQKALDEKLQQLRKDL